MPTSETLNVGVPIADTRVNLAVYGTLRMAMGNHRYIREAGGELLGSGVAHGWGLWASGIPYAYEVTGGRAAVEVYSVPLGAMLGPIDGLEGHPRWYTRREVPIELDRGRTVTAWLYEGPAGRRGTVRIPGDDYAVWRFEESPVVLFTDEDGDFTQVKNI